jgi:hypothetical protein
MLAAAIGPLLAAAAPDLVLLELPEELQPWLEWLGAEDLVSPVALAASRRDGRGLVFYPYADFSPELAALRWARAHNVPVQAFDLPVGLAVDDADSNPRRTQLTPSDAPLSEALRRAVGAADADELWDRTVEARSAGVEPEAIRRASLAVGWSLRVEQAAFGEIPESDLRRENWMRKRLREAGAERPAAVVGAFHAAALPQPVDEASHQKPVEVITSLVPYDFELLDSRSGYPAGIRDPEWQQGVYAGGGTPVAVARTVSRLTLRICRELRARGHPAGVPDAREVVRVTADLANLRGLAVAGRRELIEALQSVLTQGEPLGRGRAVAAGMQVVLTGKRRGRLGAGTPRSGLAPHVEALLEELGLPGADHPDPVEMRLDPLRSALDRRRHVTLQRLRTCGVPYAHPISVDADHLTGLWVLRWSPATSAVLEHSSHRGVTLEQAAEGILRGQLARARSGDGPSAHLRIELLGQAAECALPRLVGELLDDLESNLPHQARLAELVEAMDLCDRIRRGHVPGFEPDDAQRGTLAGRVLPTLAAAAVGSIEGLAGSDRLEDAQALLALAQRLARGDPSMTTLGDTRLRWGLEHLEGSGSPLMQGASGAVRVLLGHLEPDAFGERMGAWVDRRSPTEQSALARRIAGALSLAAPLVEAAPAIVDRLVSRVGGLNDAAFLQRLPALRDGFDVLSPAARQRFLAALRSSLPDTADLELAHSAALLARWAEADLHGRDALAAHGLPP